METFKYIAQILALSQAGRLLFPASQDKKPLISGWPQLATTDESQLRTWFEVDPPPNPAVVTGHQSGFFCLDVDGDAGKASLAELETRY
ncbi:bifunctional DNA primase/polymerase, partial [Deltaproteobacteria bacterium OttesenSCG-928-M10]|nr:bifunctional DNA primase/polymerase [Deltaproteobacteria bacterium OttesenSCG-928-M10]